MVPGIVPSAVVREPDSAAFVTEQVIVRLALAARLVLSAMGRVLDMLVNRNSREQKEKPCPIPIIQMRTP